MNLGSVHHIGYLVRSIIKSIDAFDAIGYEMESNSVYDSERKANFCFMVRDGLRIELVEPCKESDIFPLLKTYNNSPYHVCYCVQDIDEAVYELKKQGFLLFKEKQAAPAISETAIVAFLMHARMGIIELLQEG